MFSAVFIRKLLSEHRPHHWQTNPFLPNTSKKNREKIKGVLSASSASLSELYCWEAFPPWERKLHFWLNLLNNGDTLRKSLIYLPSQWKRLGVLPQLNIQLLTSHSSLPMMLNIHLGSGYLTVPSAFLNRGNELERGAGQTEVGAQQSACSLVC